MSDEDQNTNALLALSPLDGRYANKVLGMSCFFSEYALINERFDIEIEWLKVLLEYNVIPESPRKKSMIEALDEMKDGFGIEDALAIKEIEKETNHDVKAVEVYIRKLIQDKNILFGLSSYIHFACTSEDINNIAYGSLLIKSVYHSLIPFLDTLLVNIGGMVKQGAKQPMLSRTHGQSATPTTLGKEFSVFYNRIKKQRDILANVRVYGKINGAVGNYNAHYVAYPEHNWEHIAGSMLSKFCIMINTHTTQIEPQDYMCEIFDALARINSIMIDMARDIWTYISLGYFKQAVKEGEVGSSTMPHKVNPIDFENAEGNLGMANASLKFLSSELPTSRLQRDLTNSTILRNIGVAFGHTYLAYKSMQNGFLKLVINQEAIDNDIDNAWEVLAEPLQTMMRKYGISDAYDIIKNVSRGQPFTKESYLKIVEQQTWTPDDKERMLNLTPRTYLGIAEKLSEQIYETRILI